MKKIIMIAAVAIAAAACSKTIDTNPAASEKAIGFSSWNETMTKAHVGSNWADGETFKVYATKTSANSGIVFDGQDVVYDGTATTWGYSPIKFWDITATDYTFFAFLPAGQLADEASAGQYAADGKFSSKEVSFTNPTANTEDILVASKYVREKGTNPALSTAAVNLAFNHAASLVDIKVKMDASLASMGTNVTVAVTAASLVDIRTKGTLTVKEYGSDNKPVFDGFGWTPDATPTVGNYAASATPTVTSETTYVNGVATSTDPAAHDMFTNYVVMPQDLTNGQKLVLSYTITTDDGNGASQTATYTDVPVLLENFVKTDNTTNSGDKIVGWMPGVHYIYYVTIGANAITFTASVNDWATEVISGYRYILN